MRTLLCLGITLLALSCSPKIAPFGEANGAYGASFDHYAINVTDLDRSAEFYMHTFALDTIYNGTGNDRRVWMSLGEGMALHIIETDRADVTTTKGVHLCMAVNDFAGFVQHLRDENIAFETWTGEKMKSNKRPDGVQQVYVQDPDGYWIEVNDNRMLWEKNRAK
ncbi:VOC family protein [Lewinella sp. IMCC34183]|uniref:VOC family protein n=1 Tax=Lewinella sp. IMCC34183 TaxID=2248762 RepID=UPI000E2877D3|nr:VOC family protein [Lewinella sp. IMCC34183]